MEITYNREDIAKDIKNIISTAMLDVKCKPIKNIYEESEKYNGPPIGFAPPEGWVNFSEFVLGFIFSDEFSKGILSAAVWDTIKKSFSLLKQKKETPNDKLAILSDSYFSSCCRKNILFILRAHQSEKEAELAIEQIPEVRKRLLSFLEVANINNDTLQLIFVDRWIVTY